MLDFNASSERGGGLAAPRVHQQLHGYRYKDGAPVSVGLGREDIRALLDDLSADVLHLSA
jgi:hypothetical protein